MRLPGILLLIICPIVSLIAGCAESRRQAADRAAAMSEASEMISKLTVERAYWIERADFEARRGAHEAARAYKRGKTDGFNVAIGAAQCTLTTRKGSE